MDRDLVLLTPKNSKEDFLTSIAQHNPNPTFVFDSDGHIVFKNCIAESTFKEISDINQFDLNIDDLGYFISSDAKKEITYKQNEKTFKLNIIGASASSTVIIYISDITNLLKTSEELAKTQRDFTLSMSLMGEGRTNETINHIKRVSEYSKIIATEFGMSDDEIKLFYLASSLHDIGNVLIPDNILNKPDKLTKEEFDLMKDHTTYGYEMLKNYDQPIFKLASTIAYQHHEKYDGSGYPQGLIGEEIDIHARIFTLADVFDALASDRVYKKAWDIEIVLDLIKSERGQQFDPQVVDIFLKNLHKFIEIKEKYRD